MSKKVKDLLKLLVCGLVTFWLVMIVFMVMARLAESTWHQIVIPAIKEVKAA